MAKKVYTKDYYSLDHILQHKSSYYVIIGERSNGKTYSVKSHMLKKQRGGGGKFLYLRRKHKYITRQKMYKLFNDMEDLCVDIYDSTIQYKNDIGFYVETDSGIDVLGYCTSIEDAMDFKGVPFNDVTTIFFDEFMDYTYFEDEIRRFLNIISTVVRNRENLEIFMVANTISRYCPYFELLRVEVQKLQQGKIHILNHKGGVSVAVEYCKSLSINSGSKKEKKHKYLGFDDNENVKMILYGEFEQKDVEVKSVDGKGWDIVKRRLPVYVTYAGDVFEISLHIDKDYIAFVRTVNTQDGKVKRSTKYNIAVDNSVTLVTIDGIVPRYKRISKFMGTEIVNMFDTVRECVRCGRIVYDNALTGTEFEEIIAKI